MQNRIEEYLSAGNPAYKSAEEILRQQDYFIRQVTNATPDMIFVLNIQQMQLSFVNSPTACLLRVSENELYQNGQEIFRSRIHPEDRERREDFTKNLHTLKQEEVRTTELRLRATDDHYRWYKLRDKIFEQDQHGKVLQTICIVQDVNERRHAEQENARLEKQQQEMEARQQKEVLSAVLSAQEEERRRLAERLHEGLGQTLFGVKMIFEQLKYDPLLVSSKSFQQYRLDAERLLTESIKETRRIAGELMPPVLADFGLAEAIEDLCARFTTQHLHVSCNIKSGNFPLEKYLEIMVYRLLQDVIAAIADHGCATRAVIELVMEGKNIKLSAWDNCKSPDQQNSRKEGPGMHLITSKVKLLKGSIGLTSNEKGTQTILLIPVD